MLDEAMAARVMSDVPGAPGRLRFAHVLIRDTLYEGLTSVRRVRLHRCAIEALGALLRRRGRTAPRRARAPCDRRQRVRQGGFDYARARGDQALAPRVRGGCAALRDGTRGARARGPARRANAVRAAPLARRSTERGRGTRGGEARSFLEAAGVARRLRPPPRARTWPRCGYGGRTCGRRAGRPATGAAARGEHWTRSADERYELRARLLARLAGALRDEPLARPA